MNQGTTVAHLDLDSDERFQLIRRALGVTTFGINLITLAPGERGRIHRHERQEEVMLVLEGVLDVDTADGTTELAVHDAMRIAPDVRRQLINRGPDRCVVLALGGAEPHDSRDGVAYLAFDDADGRSPQEIPNPPDLEPGELRSAPR